jgi:hypothetical protein
MKGYLKLAMFLAVLLFSVGLMSVAIDTQGPDSSPESRRAPRKVRRSYGRPRQCKWKAVPLERGECSWRSFMLQEPGI